MPRGISGDKADEVTLRLLGSYELLLEDYAARREGVGRARHAAPKDKEALSNRAWWAYSLLKQYKNAEALAVVKDQPLTDKQPELAYVTAWAKWRTGDDAGAWQAIVTAAEGLGHEREQDVVDRDVLLFAGRAGGSLDRRDRDADADLRQDARRASTSCSRSSASRPISSPAAGRTASQAIDKAIEVEGDKVPANDKPVLRYTQADYTVRLDDPAAAAKFAKQAIDALPACGAKCSDKDKENVVESVYIMGRLFHILYATANDDRYYEPAHDLYTIVGAADHDERRGARPKREGSGEPRGDVQEHEGRHGHARRGRDRRAAQAPQPGGPGVLRAGAVGEPEARRHAARQPRSRSDRRRSRASRPSRRPASRPGGGRRLHRGAREALEAAEARERHRRAVDDADQARLHAVRREEVAVSACGGASSTAACSETPARRALRSSSATMRVASASRSG